MRGLARYSLEFGLLALVAVVSVLGFWDIYFSDEAAPEPHHHLHLVTAFVWIGLLATQLAWIASGKLKRHRTLGLAVLLVAPVLIGTSVMLTVHSAYNGVVSGQGDFLIVQNVMVSLELALLVILAFVFRRNRELHGNLLLSSAILFGGIATFFTLISFVPMFQIEGPETFYRFGTAAITGQVAWLVIGFGLFVARRRRQGWPFLLVGASFPLNEAIEAMLEAGGLIDPLTRAVGSVSQPGAFAVSGLAIAAILAALVLRRKQSK